ncbi:hypothetical protein [Enterococcus dongliensis]|uniref:hypothetical protein n=1 Tax=Enterococcus dongliensis TaxID=2559925 RepID=UPI00288D0A82|nr:hypothetical protein [Enterococcus dongliensis]MDT2673281.1 hypothetical protein [Enterococcus dongliensis]
MRTLQKFLFYMSSFMPLYVLLFIQNFQFKDINGDISLKRVSEQFDFSNTTVSFFWWGLIVLFCFSLIGCLLFFFVYTKKNGVKSKMNDAEFVREDTMGYIVTYIVPILSIQVDSQRSLIVNLLLFVIIGTFYVKNDQIFMNPIYNLFNYNVFSTEKGIYITKISKYKLKNIVRYNLDVYKINVLADIYVLKEAK